MRVLIVAPQTINAPILDAATEATRIGDIAGVDATILAGRDVTRDRLLNRLQRGPYTIALWIGHGEPSRLLLSDGSTIDPRWLADQLSFAEVKVAILSVCWSSVRPSTSAPVLGFTDTIPALGVTLVAMSTDVGDKAAAEYDVTFVQSFASGATIRRSHETGLEAIAKYGEAQAPQLFSADPAGTASSMKKLTDEIASLETSITEGHPDAAHASLVQITKIVGDIDRRLSEAYHVTFRNSAAISHLTERVDRIDATVHPPTEVRFYQAGVGFGILLVVASLVAPPLRDIVFAVPAFGAFALANVIALTALSARGVVLAQRKQINGTNKK
jgi:hypothetical protein